MMEQTRARIRKHAGKCNVLNTVIFTALRMEEPPQQEGGNNCKYLNDKLPVLGYTNRLQSASGI